MNPECIAGEWMPLHVLPNGALFVTRKGVLAVKVNSTMVAIAPGIECEVLSFEDMDVKQVAIADLLSYVRELEEKLDDLERRGCST